MNIAATLLTIGIGSMLARDCGASSEPSSGGSSSDAAAADSGSGQSDSGTPDSATPSVDAGGCVSTGGPSVTAGCQACLDTQVNSGKISLQQCRDAPTCVCCLTNATGSGISPKPGSCQDTPLFAAIKHYACELPECTTACATECGSFWK